MTLPVTLRVQQNELVKASKLKGVPRLEDANEAGTENGFKCTLILTAGESAMSLAVSGLGVIGRDYYGVYHFRGKLLNVMEATPKHILENAEFNNLVKIIGLQYEKKYNSPGDIKSLRYGKVIIMTDLDKDSHMVKILVLIFIHHNWPELLRQTFLEEFRTPIVKARKKNQELSFYYLPHFEEWKRDTPNYHTFEIKYCKGLGTSTSKEAKEYFSNMARYQIQLRYNGSFCNNGSITLVFTQARIDGRKEGITNLVVYSSPIKVEIPFRFQLMVYSNTANLGSIPCLVDGFTPVQRKVLFACIKRNDKREVEVSRLAGLVAGHSGYPDEEYSFHWERIFFTIVNLAQNYVGSNNINLLGLWGEFDIESLSSRFIFTKMSPLTRMIFHPHDDPLLKHEYHDNQKIEPVWYMPIIPMVLVNGADGVGPGFMTKIPNYNPRDLVNNLRRMLDGEKPEELIPWYKNFKGTIEYCGDSRYCISGKISRLGNELEITELPVGTWPDDYAANTLEAMLNDSEKGEAVLQDCKGYNTPTKVRFVVTPKDGQLERMEKEGLLKVFQLQTFVTTTSMWCFDESGCLRRFDSVMEILQEFYTLRLKMYQKRKDYLEGMLEAEAKRLSNQVRFIMQNCDGSLTVNNKKYKTIVDELIKRSYDPDPVKELKRIHLNEDEEEAPPEEEEELQESEEKKNFKYLTYVKKFDYLLGMSMSMLTEKGKDELLKQKYKKLAELDALQRKSNSDLWREDLDAFMNKLDEVEEKERKEEGSE